MHPNLNKQDDCVLVETLDVAIMFGNVLLQFIIENAPSILACRYVNFSLLTIWHIFFPIPLKGFWSEDRQKIRVASFLKQIKSATYLKNLLEEMI